MRDAPIKIGIVLDDMNAPAWVEKSLSLLRQLSFVQIDIIVLSNRTQPKVAARPTCVNGWWYRFVRTVLKKIARLKPDALAAYKTVDLLYLLPDVGHIQLNAGDTRSKTEVLSRLASRDLDVILDFGEGEQIDYLCDCAKYGIWSFRFGNDKSCYGMPVGFWEVIMDAPAIRSALVIKSSDFPATRVLYQSYSPVDSWSVELTNSQCLWRSATFPARVLNNLFMHQQQSFDHLPQVSYARNRAAASLSGAGGCGGLFNLVLHKLYSRNKERVYDILYWE